MDIDSFSSLEVFDQQKALARDSLAPANGFILVTFHDDASQVPDWKGEPDEDGTQCRRIHSCITPEMAPAALAALQGIGKSIVGGLLKESLRSAPDELKELFREALAVEPEEDAIEETIAPAPRLMTDEEIASFLAQFPQTDEPENEGNTES